MSPPSQFQDGLTFPICSDCTGVETQALSLLEQLMRCPEGGNPRRILIEGLRSLDGVSGAWLGRPDYGGRVLIDTVSDAGMQSYLDCIEIRVDESPEGRGAVGRAWRSQRVEWVDDWLSEPAVDAWREAVLEYGFRSSAAIVLHGRDRAREILAVYSDRVAWFASESWTVLIAHIATVFGLVLEEWDLKRRLQVLAHLDPLTELPNRRALDDYLERALERGRRREIAFAVGIVDLDDFKQVNDRLGHGSGDLLLQVLARRMRTCLRREDFLARLGGDEFVVVFEDIAGTESLQARLERLHLAITAPIELLGGQEVQIEASLGLVSWPQQQGADAEIGVNTLILRADLALYQAKSSKAVHECWWSMYAEDTPDTPELFPASRLPSPMPPYGDAASQALGPVQDLLAAVSKRFIESLYADPDRHPRLVELFRALSPHEFERLKARQSSYFGTLGDPTLREAEHEAAAKQAGRLNAAFGFDATWVTGLYEAYLDSLLTVQPLHSSRLRRVLPVISTRLTRDRRAQMEAYKEIAESHRALTERLTWHLEEARDSLHLTEFVVEALSALDEVAAVCAARMETTRAPVITAIKCTSAEGASRLAQSLDVESLSALATTLTTTFSVEACSGCKIRNYPSFTTAEALPHRLRICLQDLGLRSAATLTWPGLKVSDRLYIFSRHPGGFSGTEQRAFLKQIGQLLSLGWRRLPDTGAFSVADRHRRRAALRTGGLVMHYQPVIDLQTGRLVKVEALARLREADLLLTPDRFLPVFDNDDLFQLYQLGLRQALQDARDWAGHGQYISLGLNILPQGLGDKRYVEATSAALRDIGLPAGQHLYLEMLETENLNLTNPERLIEWFEPWLALGVRFAQDDLGAGHSSLLRLHRLPFEVVKIDQGLIRSQGTRPNKASIRKVLAFVADLTNLAHTLGVRVCVEGLESPELVEAAAALGVDFGQGFAIARPMPSEAVAGWAHSDRTVSSRNLNSRSGDFKAFYRQLRFASEQFGINSSAYSRARSRLYDLLGEHIVGHARG